MIRFAKPYLLFAVLSITCWAQSTLVSINQPVHGIPTRSAQANSTSNGIQYGGGPVMNLPSGTNVYFIWYGDWSVNPGAKPILTDFVQRLGGSPYFNINTTYYDIDKAGQQDPVFNKVNYGASVNDNYSMGQSLSDFDVFVVVGNHMGVDLPIDTNGVYFVLTSPDVSEQEFATVFCAWHNNGIYSNPGVSYDIKVAFVGDPHNFFHLCGVQNPSPNNNPDADSMATFVAHELEESVTDPDGC
jgi:hypothetical protein